MQTEKKKMYTVFSIKLVNWLVRQGNELLQAIDSPTDPTRRYKAFLFEDTDKLQRDITNFTIINRKDNDSKHGPTNLSVSSNRRGLQKME